MFRRLLGAVLALGLLFGGMAVTAPAPVAAANPCLTALPTNQAYMVYKWYGNTAQGTRFDRVTGRAYVSNLENCDGPGPGQVLGTAILPANIESSRGIFQVGYKDDAVYGLRFIWADFTGDVQSWPTNVFPKPIIGHLYKFSVTLPPAANQYVTFTIQDKTTGVSQTIPSTATFGGTSSSWGYLAWWGAERLDTQSGIGSSEFGAPIVMNTMSYRNSGVTYYRDHLDTRTSNVNDIDNEPPSATYDMYKHSGFQPAACYHGEIDTLDNPDDVFNPWTEEQPC